jgi:hypothetical protein
VRHPSQGYRLDGPLKLRVARELGTEQERFDFVTELLQTLAPRGTGAVSSPA